MLDKCLLYTMKSSKQWFGKTFQSVITHAVRLNHSNFYEPIQFILRRRFEQPAHVEFLIATDNLGAYRIIRRIPIMSRINSD